MGNDPAFHGIFAVRTVRAEPDPRGRLLAVSDIHGHARLLEELLAAMELQGEDTLVFLGDYIERGPESLDALRLVMRLCRERPRTWALLGNMDAHKVWEIGTDTDANAEGLRRNIEFFGGSLFGDMCRELGLGCATRGQIAAAKGPVREAFREELAFLRGLPTILDTPQAVFVHGGLPVDDPAALEGTEFFACGKFDRFAERTAPLRRRTVVGHWPTCLYRSGVSDGSPYWRAEKNVLSIDGGCGLRYDAQLNAVWLDPAAPASFRWTASSRFPQAIALEAQKGRPARTQFRWPHSRACVLSRGGGIAEVEQRDTGRRVRVPEAFLFTVDGEQYVNDCTDEELEIAPGERFSLIARTDEGAYVRRGSVSGWYRGGFRPCAAEREPWHEGRAES